MKDKTIFKLQKKDYRILAELDQEANQSLSELAKKVGVSRQVAEYRLQRLVKNKVIYAFYTLVDVGKIGYTTFRVHLKLKNVTEQAYTAFARDLFTSYPTFWVAFMSGSFDIITDIFARTPNEFEEIFAKVLEKHRAIIHSYETLTLLELDLYEYAYFLGFKVPRHKKVMLQNKVKLNLDVINKNILQMIKYNSRLSYEAIAHQVGLSRNAVKQRILKLEQQGIIAGYKMMIDFRHFDQQSYKIFIRYNNAKLEQEKLLLNFLKETPGDLATTKLLGRWNLDVEIHFKDSKELQQFIIGLRNKFEIIEDYEIAQIIEDYGIDFFPEKVALN